MKLLEMTLIASTLSLMVTPSVQASDVVKNYNNTPNHPAITEMLNGAIGNTASITQAGPLMRASAELQHETVVGQKNVHFIGRDLYAPVVIEVDEGLIVFGSGDHDKDGIEYRKYIRENISDKPIIAVMYDHNHYIKGTRGLIDGDKAMLIAHPELHTIVSSRTGDSQANTDIPEMAPHLLARANIHYGVLADKKGRDAAILEMGIYFGAENGYMEPTHTLKDGEKITIGGLEIQAFHHITDTKDTLTFYIPEYSMVIDNVVWPAVNMYTLRGDAYRAPETWLNALRDIRDLNADYVLTVGGGAKVLYGTDHIRETINATLDAQSFSYDQAIRLTNLGVQPDQLVHYMPIPAESMTHPYVNNVYGQFDTYPASFAVRNHGSFSGNPEDIHNLPKQLQAKYTIKLAGGVDKVYKAWKEARDNAEYLWAKELSATLYYNAPANKSARQAHADSLRKLGQYSEGAIVRQFYIAGAKSLETADPKYTLTSTPSAEWVATDPVTATDYLRTRINPGKAAGVHAKLAFNVDGKLAQLEIRNSIAEFTTVNDDDAVVLKVSGEDYGKYYTGELKAKDIASGKALELLAVFDEYVPVTMFPTSFDHLK